MSSRALKMVQLVKEQKNLETFPAQKLIEKKRGKENRIPTKETNRTNSLGDTYFLQTFFHPIVTTETRSSFNATFMNLDDIIQNCNTHIFNRNNQVNRDEDELEFLDFDSDDSLKDPHYHVQSDSESVSSSGSTSEELQNAAKQIELNLLEDESASGKINVRDYDSKKLIQVKRNTGNSYKRKSGTVVAARTCVPLQNCRRNCKYKISFEVQRQLFQKYWDLGSYNKRAAYLSSLIDIEDKKSQRLDKKPNSRNRQHSSFYFIELNGIRTKVCQSCFLLCFGETVSFVKTLYRKKITGENISYSDKRGCKTPSNKLSDQIISSVIEHINSFPVYESHYSRRDSSKKYLGPNLTITKMHELYTEKFGLNAISLSSYSKVFHSTGLKFKSPKIDSCHTCDLFKAQIEVARINAPVDVPNLEAKLENHHAMADLAYKSKEKDKKLSVEHNSVKTYSFDLQKCLPTPFLNTSVAFYKRPLWTFNLTVHDGGTGDAYCYMWHEATAKRGGNEIASCLFKHLQSLGISNNVKHLIFYSDCCPGQNKNSFLSAMFLTFLTNNENISTIDHKFLVPGHTHMECDVDHSLIERKKKRTEVKLHHPHDWFNFVRTVGNKRKLNVIEMNKPDFWNFSSLLSTRFLWRKRAEGTETFYWNNVKWLRYEKNSFGKILYKNSLEDEEEFKVLNITKRGINTVTFNDIPNITEEIKIPLKKKKDLIDMLPLIDPAFHQFYKSLPTEDTDFFTHPDLTEVEEIAD